MTKFVGKESLNKTDYSGFDVIGYPVRHRKKDPFQPYPGLPKGYRRMILDLIDMDHRLDGYTLGSQDCLDLVLKAHASNIHWSTKIEGNPLTQDEVEMTIRHFTSGKREEIRSGYAQEIVNHLYPLFYDEDIETWDLDFIRSIHRILLKDTGYKGDPGEFRKEPVSVVGSDGFEYFITCPHTHIESELDNLMKWLEESPFDSVCTAAVFFHEFESIHPFRDGNGRTGRVLMQMLLQRLGLYKCGLCKFESHLLKDSEQYYRLLAYTDSTGDYGPFIMFVAESLHDAYEEAIETFREKDRIKDADEVTKTIIQFSKSCEYFTIHDISAAIPSVHENTLRNKLNVLMDEGIITKTGKYRSTRYSFDDPIRKIRMDLDWRPGSE